MSFESVARSLGGRRGKSLDQKIAELLRAISDGDGEDIVVRYPELMSMEARNRILKISEESGEKQWGRILQNISTVLERCEMLGAKVAFDEWRQRDKLRDFLAELLLAETDADLTAVLTQNKSLLEAADRRLGQLFSESSEYSQASSDELRKVLRDAKAIGIERAVANRRALLDDRQGKRDPFSDFLSAETDEEEFELLCSHPSLSAPEDHRKLKKFLEIAKKAPSRDRAFENRIARKLTAVERFRQSSQR